MNNTNDIDSKLKQAYISGDAALYKELCADYGIEPLDFDLYIKGKKLDNKESDYEKRALDWEKRFDTIPKNWGIFKYHITNLPNDMVENIWYGMNNIEMPYKIIDIMNQDEILGKYHSIGLKKRFRDNKKFSGGILNLLDLIHEDEKKLSEKMVDVKKQFTEPLTTRLYTIPEIDINNFIKSFKKDYIPPVREQPIGGLPYDMKGGHTKKAYADFIFKRISHLYIDSFNRI